MDREAMVARADEITAAWNRGDAAGVTAHTREDATFRDMSSPEPVRGRAAIQAAAQEYMTAFPDLHVEDRSNICDGDMLVQEWIATGTHDGRLLQVRADPPQHPHRGLHGGPIRRRRRDRRNDDVLEPDVDAGADRRAPGARRGARLTLTPPGRRAPERRPRWLSSPACQTSATRRRTWSSRTASRCSAPTASGWASWSTCSRTPTRTSSTGS